MPEIITGQDKNCRFWKISAAVAIADILLWLIMVQIGGRPFIPVQIEVGKRVIDSMIGVWNVLHWPVGNILLPMLADYMPSHGGGWKSFVAESTYVLCCALWLAIFVGVTFALICLVTRRVRRKV